MTKLFLGKTKETFNGLSNEQIFITKHSWDCGWYFGFGYIGNKDLHTHFDLVFLGNECKLASEIFRNTNISDKNWWIIRDLFIQAYSLSQTAKVYRHGGYQTKSKGTTDIVESDLKYKAINEDLKIVLDTLWEFLVIATQEKE